MSLNHEKAKKMADGGEVLPGESPIITYLRNYMTNHGGAGIADQNEAEAAKNVEASTDTVKGYSDGGTPDEDDKDKKDAPIYTGVTKTPMTDVPPILGSALNKTIGIGMTEPSPMDPNHPAKGLFLQKRFAEGGVAMPSDEEKRDMVRKALEEKTLKLDDGGTIDPSQLPTPTPTDPPNKLQMIIDAIRGGATNLSNSPAAQVAGAVMNPVSAISNAVQKAAPSILGAEGPAAAKLASVAGGQAPIASLAPQTPPPAAAVPTPEPAPMPPVAPVAATSTPSTPDPLAQLGKFDPTTVAPGMNPGDRQALAGQLNTNQHSVGNLVAEAMAGIGDALSARGGTQQNSLGSIIALQKQQRDEALGNFDKAREIAVQNHTLKNQADQELINNVKAHGETVVSPQIASSLGHPEWANKPIAQVSLALSGQKNVLDYTNQLMQRKHDALKESADSIDQALKSGGIGGTQKMMDPQSRLKLIYSNAIRNDPEAFGYQISQAGK